MKIAIIGNPNVGKTELAKRFVGAFYMPLHVIRIASSREDRARFMDAQVLTEMFPPNEFRIKSGCNVHAAERHVIDKWLDGSTKYQGAFDMDVVAFMVKTIYALWDHKENDIVVEGEIVNKVNWMAVIDPDRIIFVGVPSTRGIPHGVRKGQQWPDKHWTDESYFEFQRRLLSRMKGWLE